MNATLRRNTLSLMLLLASTISLLAQDEKEIRVDRITPKIINRQLTVSATFENLFSNRIIATIQSGLPSIVNVEIKLLEREEKQLVHKLISRSISYNIWEEHYTLTSEDTLETFSDFNRVKETSSRLDHTYLAPDSILDGQSKYRIQLRVAIIPISARQGAKVNDWLLDPNQTEESLASEERSSGFKFTLSNLVSFFVRDRRQSKYNSRWFSSEPFSSDQVR